MQDHMVEGKTCDLRNARSLLLGSLDHNTVLIKIHITAKISDITRQRLLVHRDADGIPCLDGHIHHLDKGNVLHTLIPVFQGQKQRIVPQSAPHNHIHNFFIRIVHAPVHINGRHLVVFNNIKTASDKEKKEDKKNRE